DFENIKIDSFTARVEHDFSDETTLRNTSRYGRSDQERVLTAPLQAPNLTATSAPSTWTLGRNRQASYRENQILTNQTNITTKFKTGSIEHELATGIEFIYEKQYTPTYASVTVAPTNLYNPDRNVNAAMPAPNGVFNDGNTVTSAAYAFDTWKLNPQWELTTGL